MYRTSNRADIERKIRILKHLVMKPTPRQKQLIEEVANQASFWMNTNDLQSPTHYCDIEDEIALLKLDDILTTDEAKKFEDLLGDLFDFIKSKS